MSKYGIAHHQSDAVVLQSQTLKQKQVKGLASQDYSCSLHRQTWMSLMAEISALDPWSLLGLITLVAAFVNSSKRGPYAC